MHVAFACFFVALLFFLLLYPSLLYPLCCFIYANLALDKRPLDDVVAGHAGMRRDFETPRIEHR